MVPLGKVKVFSSMTSNSKNFEMLYKIEKQMTGMTKVLVEYTCLKSKKKKVLESSFSMRTFAKMFKISLGRFWYLRVFNRELLLLCEDEKLPMYTKKDARRSLVFCPIYYCVLSIEEDLLGCLYFNVFGCAFDL